MPRFRPGKCQKSGTTNPAQALAKAASDAAFASTGVNPAPMGRPWPTKEGAAAMERPSPTQEAGDATGSGKKKRKRGAATAALTAMHQMNVDPTCGALSEAEIRVAIKVIYVHVLGCPGPEHWSSVKDDCGTMTFIQRVLTPTTDNPWACHHKPRFDTIRSVLERVWEAAVEGKDVDVSHRRVTEKGGSGGHHRARAQQQSG